MKGGHNSLHEVIEEWTMAWYCSSSSNAGLVSNLKQQGIIRHGSVIEALKQVDRANFVKSSMPYDDSPQYIGCGQTISAPHMHGYALENLASAILSRNAMVLDVGVGSGYLAAAMARMNPTATVYGIDVYPELVDLSYENIKKKDSDLLDTGRVKLVVNNGWEGYIPGAPYDAIHVGAGAEKLPKELLRQLKVGGRMVIPVGTWMQELLVIDRVGDSRCNWAHDLGEIDIKKDYHIKHLMPVRYVPLVHDEVHKKG